MAMIQTWKKYILFTLYIFFSLLNEHIQLHAFMFKYKYFKEKGCLLETLNIGYDREQWVGWPQISSHLSSLCIQENH